MTEFSEAVNALNTSLVDSRNGYEEALEDAEGKGLTPLFRAMIDMRTRHIGEIEPMVVARGEEPDKDGSIMSTVHRTIIRVRSLFSDLDERIIPGLVDGEKRTLEFYDDAIELAPANEKPILMRQADEVRAKIREMEQRKSLAA